MPHKQKKFRAFHFPKARNERENKTKIREENRKGKNDRNQTNKTVTNT